MKYEAKKIMYIFFLETLNIEWGQIYPKINRRVKSADRCILLQIKQINTSQNIKHYLIFIELHISFIPRHTTFMSVNYLNDRFSSTRPNKTTK